MYKDVWENKSGTIFIDPISKEVVLRSRETSQGGELTRIDSDTMILIHIFDGAEIWKK